MKDMKDVVEALRAIEARLASIEGLLGDAVRSLGPGEAPAGSGITWGKGPADAYGNLVPHC